MQHQTIKLYTLQTIDWLGDKLVDWANGVTHDLQHPQQHSLFHSFGFSCDRAITSADGRYAFIYQSLGTKGLLLKEGNLLREINRAYYHADTHEYPAAFVMIDEVTYLVHCPLSYDQLDFENVETGELLTAQPGREPTGFFHSRLEVSPEGGYLMSKGWYWHPWDTVKVYDVRACLQNPLLLDNGELRPPVSSELCSACFISEHEVVLVSSNEEPRDEEEALLPDSHLARWNILTDEVRCAVPLQPPFGNVFPIDEGRVWDLYKYPKIINLSTGAVEDELPSLHTGLQNSSIIHHLAHEDRPAIVYDRRTKRIALRGPGRIDVLTPDEKAAS